MKIKVGEKLPNSEIFFLDQNNDVNLASQKPERVNTMIGRIKEWKDEINVVRR